MAAVIHPPEPVARTVVLHNVSWETYERLLAEQQDSGARLSYDRGALEIMILSLRHERIKHLIATLVEMLALARNIDLEGAGSTTFRRRDLARGFEPDACFYFTHAALIRGKEEIDLGIDPAPELAIEVDLSHASLDKQPIMAGLGIAEIWRYDGHKLHILRLDGDQYRPRDASTVLPGISDEQLNRWIEAGQTLKRGDWLRGVREELARGGVPASPG